ncbi:MAG: 2,3,4,5-tetrahydropyridine-2,6-dicarboxylate N-acetyltransferase [Erysipelotrichales bacterium]|nr:2,3,4,5-tetrahydropyridine-2,6-dicarboxylate N-acetyltransferase [Erysipelotrichales bacterium]
MNRIVSPVRAYIKCKDKFARMFKFAAGCEASGYVVVDELEEWNKLYSQYQNDIELIYLETLAINSRYSLEDLRKTKARVEFGAVVREGAILSDTCIVLMGAVVNVGARIGENTMIDMNAVVGSGAVIGDNCHISAGVVIAGIMEPISSENVIIEDNVFIGANSVVFEGVKIGRGSIVGAGSIVTKDVEESSVVYGNPAKIIRSKKDEDNIKVQLNQNLRK